MVISDDHRYLFLEIPYTASTAMAQELVDSYNGRWILKDRHAPYDQFRRIASSEQKGYLVIAGIRNPLDTIVTVYLKSIRKNLIPGSLDFPSYFDSTYRFPYANFVSLSARHIDCLIRYEALQDDLEVCLNRLRINKLRSLPARNRTTEKSKHYLDYYTPEIIPKVKRVLGPFMVEWGYEFPTEWGEYHASSFAKTTYRLVKAAKVRWWTYMWQRKTAASG